jgi:hypothetical protein
VATENRAVLTAINIHFASKFGDRLYYATSGISATVVIMVKTLDKLGISAASHGQQTANDLQQLVTSCIMQVVPEYGSKADVDEAALTLYSALA